MAKKDIYSDLLGKVSVAPQFVNSNTTLTGATVDLQGFEGAVVMTISGTIAGSSSANIHTFEIQESANDSDWTAVADADLIGVESDLTHNGGSDNLVKKVGYKGAQRYIRVVDTTTAFTTAGGQIAAVVVLGAPHIAAV